MTGTKLSAFCDSMVESCLLVAIVGLPLFFNTYGVRIFEPDKAYLLRYLSVLIILFWTMKHIESGFGDLFFRKNREAGGVIPVFRTPLVLPVFVLVAAFLLSTVFSVSPWVSFFGSYDRLQGMLTMGCYALAFLAVLDTVRNEEHVERILQSIIIASVPISVYGILQHYAIDVLPWMDTSSERTGATLGNPIFLGAYLGMVLPVTIYRMVDLYLDRSREETKRHSIFVPVMYGMILSLQLLALLFTQSRGPWLGAAAAVYLFLFVGLLFAARSAGCSLKHWRSDLGSAMIFAVATLPVGAIPGYLYFLIRRKGFRWLWIALLVQTVMGVLFAIYLVGGKASGTFVERVPYLTRLVRISNVEQGTGKVRLLIWQGTQDLIKKNPSRIVMGYGPETFKYVWSAHAPAALLQHESRKVSADRSHNATLDLISTTGLIGCCAFYLLVGCLIFYIFKWLGFIRTRRDRGIFTGFLIVCSLGALFASFSSKKLGLVSGVLFPGAILGSAFLYLLYSLGKLFSHDTGKQEMAPRRILLILALFCGIIAHLIEIQVGIATTTTQFYMFVFMAVAVVIGTGRLQMVQQPDEGVKTSDSAEKGAKKAGSLKGRNKTLPQKAAREKTKIIPGSVELRQCLPVAFIVSYMLMVLFFEFVTNPLERTNLFSVIWSSLTTSRAGARLTPSIGVVPILAATVLAGFFFVFETFSRCLSKEGTTVSAIKSSFRCLAFVLPLPFVFACVHAAMTGPDGDPGGVIIGIFTVTVIMVCLIAGSLGSMMPKGKGVRFFRARRGWVYPVPVILCVWAGVSFAVKPVMADVFCKIGMEAEQGGYYKASVEFLTRAIALSPEQDRYYLMLSRTMFNRAGGISDRGERYRYYREVLAVMERARHLAPLDVDHYINLGVVCTQIANLAPDDGTRKDMLSRAHESYQRAAELAPQKPLIYNYWSQTYILQRDYETARTKLETSLSVDNRYIATYIALGELYLVTGEQEKAIELYWQAVEKAPDDWVAMRDLVISHGKKGEPGRFGKAIISSVAKDRRFSDRPEMVSVIRFRLGERHEATQEMERLVSEKPGNNRIRIALVCMYEALGRYDDALRTLGGVVGTLDEGRKVFVKEYLETLKGSLGRPHVSKGRDPAQR